MDNKGNTLFYGEWKELFDKNNRHEVHETSFIDEVEDTTLFKNLNLNYDSGMRLYDKGILFALQGMVLMQNTSTKEESEFMMFVPEKLTELQRGEFSNLYSLLKSFESVNIVVVKTLDVSDDDVIDSVEEYYRIEGILKNQIIK